MRKGLFFLLSLSLLSGFGLSACQLRALILPATPTVDLPAALTALAPPPTPGGSESQSPAQAEQGLDAPPTDAPQPDRLWIASYLPDSVTQGLVAPGNLTTVPDRENANLWLDLGVDGIQVSGLVYALVVPFPTIDDDASFSDLVAAWGGQPSGEFDGGSLYLTEGSLALFSRWWGEPDKNFVRVVSQEDLLKTVWSHPSALALVPFEELRPEWKVLTVDGNSPIRKGFDPATYPLTLPVSLGGEDVDRVSDLAEAFSQTIPAVANRDSGKLTTVVLTGVTALVRATAYEMEDLGVLHPAEEIGPLLRDADILHISNEVPFAENCPPPQPVNKQLIFCSADKYMELLENIGTDVVELTGDHFSDWGVTATLHTFDLYDAAGWQYYGGGRTPEQGRLPITMEHNGNRIAFIGCNGKGGSYTPSVRGLPGAVDCDFNLITAEIGRLKEAGYLVIMTYQHHETYSLYPTPTLVEDFLYTAQVGADIVSGSQAHQSHGMTIYDGSLVMYGLGNLFFDQLLMGEGPSRALIARHVIYDQQHISTELITIYFEDFSKPLYLTGQERERLLEEVFGASNWGDLPSLPN